MAEEQTNLGEELIASMGEALSHARGEDPGVRETPVEVPDVRAVRASMGLTQEQFAPLLGVSVSSLQKREQGTRRALGAAATLLLVVDQEPVTVARVFAERAKYSG